MKYLSGFFFIFFLWQNAHAVNLCDSSCSLIITFPNGGSIEAVEALSITFGDNGELAPGVAGTVNVNPQPASLDFSAGGSLNLAKGESITFGDNGIINLGVGGNIDHLDLIINSSGNASLTAVDGTETITIQNLALNNGLNITFAAKVINVLGSFTLDAGTTLSLIADTSAVSPSVCGVEDSSSNVSISTGSINTVDSCTEISTSLSLPTGVITAGSIDPNATLTATATITITSDTTNADITLSEPEVSSADESGASMLGYFYLLLMPGLVFLRRIKPFSA